MAGLGFLMNERYETIFLAFSVALATYSVFAGMSHHKQKQALPLLALGVISIVLSRCVEHYEAPLAIVGALGITFAHLYNMHLHQKAHQH